MNDDPVPMDPKNDAALAPEELDTVAGGAPAAGHVFEVEDYSFDIEQTLNIGSQSQH